MKNIGEDVYPNEASWNLSTSTNLMLSKNQMQAGKSTSNTFYGFCMIQNLQVYINVHCTIAVLASKAGIFSVDFTGPHILHVISN